MEKLMQKISGIILVVLGIVSIVNLHDFTASVVIIPLGLYLFFTKEQAMRF